MVAGGRAGPYLYEILWPTTESQNAENIGRDLMKSLEKCEREVERPVCNILCNYCFIDIYMSKNVW